MSYVSFLAITAGTLNMTSPKKVTSHKLTPNSMKRWDTKRGGGHHTRWTGHCPVSTPVTEQFVHHHPDPEKAPGTFVRFQAAFFSPRPAHACICCVTKSYTIGPVVPSALPLAQRLSCQRHKSSTFGTGKRSGSQEKSDPTMALPAEGPGRPFLLHHYSHVPPLLTQVM